MKAAIHSSEAGAFRKPTAVMKSNGCHEANGSTATSAANMRVGIKALEFYFPKRFVEQTELEKFNNEGAGKYTNGMGLRQMGFCDDYEDVCSLALSVTSTLLEKYAIDPNSIGFLEVGTESLIDKSKSVKTALMRSELFAGNADIEGVDSKNACYGGTQALFHAVDWIVANYAFEQKEAIVVMTDIANYEAGPARCTGGAGAIAFLVGPNAPLVFDRGTRASYMSDEFDFYKPIHGMSQEYPVVESKQTIHCYLTALDAAYRSFQRKTVDQTAEKVSLASFDAVLCHCPFYKLVQKAYARLFQLDCQSGQIVGAVANEVLALDETAPDFWKRMLLVCRERMDEQVAPHFDFNQRIGNMYTASLYASLISVIANFPLEASDRKRVLMFSYGSGVASSMFSLRFDLGGNGGDRAARLQRMRAVALEARARLDERQCATPREYTEAIERRERQIQNGAWTAPNDLVLFPGTWHLREITERLRRNYARSSAKS